MDVIVRDKGKRLYTTHLACDKDVESSMRLAGEHTDGQSVRAVAQAGIVHVFVGGTVDAPSAVPIVSIRGGAPGDKLGVSINMDAIKTLTTAAAAAGGKKRKREEEQDETAAAAPAPKKPRKPLTEAQKEQKRKRAAERKAEAMATMPVAKEDT